MTSAYLRFFLQSINPAQLCDALLCGVAAVLLTAFAAEPAWSAGQPSEAPTSSCGVSAREAIAAAEARLRSPDERASREALSCLVVAMKRLDERQPIVEREGARNGLLRVPTYSKTMQERP